MGISGVRIAGLTNANGSANGVKPTQRRHMRKTARGEKNIGIPTTKLVANGGRQTRSG